MFTGIVEGAGRVKKVIVNRRSANITLDGGKISRSTKIGDSIAVNGVCLTVEKKRGNVVCFDVVAETLKKTTLGNLEEGDSVNLERSLRFGDRLGGHIVLGHVDGVGTIQKIEKDRRNCLLWIHASKKLLRGMVEKGSVALDGISLTIVCIKKDNFCIAIIPHTLKATTLGEKTVGNTLNIELDYVGKWIRKSP